MSCTLSSNEHTDAYLLCASVQLGALVSEDPAEEKRQKDFKSLLNKLTLDNYDTIKDKLVAVGIASETTLKGLIDQVTQQ